MISVQNIHFNKILSKAQVVNLFLTLTKSVTRQFLLTWPPTEVPRGHKGTA